LFVELRKLKTLRHYSIIKALIRRVDKFSGGFVERVTPVPIPNTEVKPLGADGTALEAAWESRKPPDYYLAKARTGLKPGGLFVFGALLDNDPAS
jgi:hypothetical protein